MNNPITEPNKKEKRRKQNAFTINLVTGVLFGLVSLIVGPIAYNESGLNGMWGIYIAAAVSLSAFIGTFLIARERVTLGAGILIVTILLTSLGLPIIAHGQGLALGIMILILVTGISSATLPRTLASRAIISALIVAAIVTIADLYFPDFGLPTQPIYTNWIAFTTTVIYIFFLLSRFNAYALRTKIILAFALITVIPLIALGFFNNRFSAQTLQAQSQTQLTTLAHILADKIDEFINTQLNIVHADAKQSDFVAYLELPSHMRRDSKEEARARTTLISLNRRDPIFIHSVALLDANGTNLLDTYNTYVGQKEFNEPYFARPIQTGLPYSSNVIFNGQDARLYFSSAIKSGDGETIGVLRVEYHAKILQSILLSLDPSAEGKSLALIDTNTYLRVGYNGTNRYELLKTYKDFSNADLAALQAEGRLPSGKREDAIYEPDGNIIEGMNNLQQQPFFNAYSESLGSEATYTGVFLKTQPWAALIRQSTKIYLAPVENQNRITILISMILIIMSIAGGLAASQVIASPINTLAKVAEQITSGDRSARAQVIVDDEIGTLAESFNRMTEQLNQSFSNLELRVVERTTDLEIARQHSENHARELQSISEISKIISGEQKLESLLPIITRLVNEHFSFQHVGIYLLNNTRQFIVLHATNSEGGAHMLADGYKIAIEDNDIISDVVRFGTPRIALDVGLGATSFNNPYLPSMRSELALPLRVRGKILGVLDIQSEKPGAFTEDNIDTFGILSDQVGIAIENARLFSQTQEALNEAQAFSRKSSQEGWLSFIREEPSIGYQQSLIGGKKLSKPVDTHEIRQVMNRGNAVILDSGKSSQDPLIVVPIKLRGQIIGALNIKSPTQDRRWSNDEVNLVEAISERLSLALENARLIQDSLHQVIKEQTIGEVTGKIGSSINLRNVLQTAVEELGRAIPGSDVIIELTSKNEDSEQPL